MTTANDDRKRGKNSEKEVENMNVRLVLRPAAVGKVLVVCALVVGLATALEVTALAGPPNVEYRPKVNSLYRSYGYNTVPKVNVPHYSSFGYQLPSFYHGWTNTGGALAASPPAAYVTWNDLFGGYDVPNNVAPLVTWKAYAYSDPQQLGGYDPWDPLGNSFGVAPTLQAASLEQQWDDYAVPNNVVTMQPWGTVQWSDPAQPGGYDPWDPLGGK